MGRLKYIVASYVVLLGLHRFANEKFILESFHSHGPTSRKRPSSNQPISASAHENNTIAIHSELDRVPPSQAAPEDDDYVVGEFCPHCTFNTDSLCIDRVNYLMQRYNIGEKSAKNNKQVLERCMAPPIPHKLYAEEDEPSVIIHAGPHKTATTALQAFMYDLIFTNETIFQKDKLRVPNYDELPGVFGKEGVGLNLAHCSLEDYKNSGGTMNIGMCAPMREAFPKFMQEAYNKSENILIVAEDFDRVELDIKRLRFFIRPYKQVKIVVMYRRLHDWLPSFYNQIVDLYTLIYAKGEEEYPSFVEWLEKNYDKFEQMHAIMLADFYQKIDYVKSVDIINMHEVAANGNLIDHFFCDHLHAKSACQAIKDGAKPSKSNIGVDHEYERLTIKASLGKKIPTSLNKPIDITRATRHMKTKAEELNVHGTLPRICPNKDLLDRILQTEIEHERTFFPEWFESQGGEAGIRQSFQKAVKKKFCSLDVDQIFASGILDSVFNLF